MANVYIIYLMDKNLLRKKRFSQQIAIFVQPIIVNEPNRAHPFTDPYRTPWLYRKKQGTIINIYYPIHPLILHFLCVFLVTMATFNIRKQNFQVLLDLNSKNGCNLAAFFADECLQKPFHPNRVTLLFT